MISNKKYSSCDSLIYLRCINWTFLEIHRRILPPEIPGPSYYRRFFLSNIQILLTCESLDIWNLKHMGIFVERLDKLICTFWRSAISLCFHNVETPESRSNIYTRRCNLHNCDSHMVVSSRKCSTLSAFRPQQCEHTDLFQCSLHAFSRRHCSQSYYRT